MLVGILLMACVADHELELVRAGQQAALHGLSPLSCVLTQTSSPETKLGQIRKQVKLVGRRLRIDEADQLRNSTTLLDGETLRTLQTWVSDGKTARTGTIASSPRWGCSAPFESFMCAFWAPENGQMRLWTFEELVPHVRRTFAAKDGDGKPLIGVQVTREEADISIEFDPSRNYAAVRCVYFNRLGREQQERHRTEWRALEFIELRPGVFLPKRVLTETSSRGKSIASSDTRCEAVSGDAIAPEALSFRFPAGVSVLDLTRQKALIARENGVLEDDPEAAKRIITNSRQLDRAAKALDMGASEAEPRHWTSYFLPGSLIFLGAAGILWFISRVRAKAAT